MIPRKKSSEACFMPTFLVFYIQPATGWHRLADIVFSRGAAMNVWIFQDAPGTNLADKMRDYPEGTLTWWHVDRYFSENASPRIAVGDMVLLWQPYLDDISPAGVHAVAQVTGEPYWPPGEKGKWRRINIRIAKVLSEPVTRAEIREAQAPDLLQMLIMRMAAGHIVFPVKPAAWEALKRLNKELKTIVR